jgi:glycosyltransferase involved in cell wall biosynthesis
MIAANGMTIDGRPAGEHGLQMPLVSVVMINRNYARFVGAAIDSVRRQDYPHFECLVIDNASTDDSRAVISRHADGDPRFTLLFLDTNLGPMGSKRLALDRIQGEFVTFLDSDDLWFSNFMSSHVQVHLALPLGIAFTSSRVVEIDADGRVITGSNLGFGFNSFEGEPRGLRSGDKGPRFSSISNADFELLSAQTTRINPEKAGWFWSPGSANMYRRNILDITCPAAAERTNFIDADIHFNRFCHILGGSAVIDRALSAYRMHGANISNALPSMSHLRTAKKERAEIQKRQRQEILRILLARAESFSWLIKNRYWRALDLQSGESGEALAEYYAHWEIQQIIAEHLTHLIAIFGSAEVKKELGQRLPATALQPLLLESAVGSPSDVVAFDQKRGLMHFPEGTLRSPLVSLVLVSFNRASFIGAVIDSLRQQDYPNFECLIVDNASADDSLSVIARHVGGDRRFTAIPLELNLGQTGAFLHVFERLRGEFVSVIDDDDILSLNFLSVHIQVHLALPKSVGFTSHDLVETATDGSALGVFTPHTSGAEYGGVGLRPAEVSLRLTTISDELYQRLGERTATIPNGAIHGSWSAGPGLFRRSALEFVLPEPGTEPVRAFFDGYFKPLCHFIFSNAIIDLPLSTYRIHGGNSFAAMKTVIGVKNGQREVANRIIAFQSDALRALLARAPKFSWAIAGDRYWEVINGLPRESSNLQSYFARPEITALFVEYYDRLVEAFGEPRVLRELRKRYRAMAWRDLVRRAHGRKLPFAVAWDMALIDMPRIVALLLRTLRLR